MSLDFWWFNATPTEDGPEDDFDMASILINEYDGVVFNNNSIPIGQRVVIIDDGKQVYKINHASNIEAGNSVSLHLENTGVNYQTSATAKVILVIRGNSTILTDFEIIEDSAADDGTGSPMEDFPAISLGAAEYITSKELIFAASKYITVKANTGTISSVTGFVIE